MTRKTAEVISIGDEMTSGARLDTNAQWLSRRIAELGIEVTFHSTVGDSLQDNIDVFRIAAERADIVVCTGGLGPTRDDLTREAMASAADQPLIENPDSLRHIKSLFSVRGREMPHRNRVQAMFPAGATEIFNAQGTAPGVDLILPRGDGRESRIFALPGVPAEMKRMFDDTVVPRILQQAGEDQVIRHDVMKFFGTGESDMESRLGDMITRDRQPRVGITVSAATISLRIAAMASSEAEAKSMIATTRAEILDRVREFYFGDGEQYEQHHAIDELLRSANQSLIVIEFGRAARLGDWFASLGQTSSFRGGLSLAESADLNRLAGTTDTLTAVRKIQNDMQADWAIVIDAYPILPTDSGPAREPETVQLLVTGPDDFVSPLEIRLAGHPSILHARIAKTAMQHFRTSIADNSTLSPKL